MIFYDFISFLCGKLVENIMRTQCLYKSLMFIFIVIFSERLR